MVYICLAEGFETIEALTLVDVFRRAGIEAKTVGITGPIVRSAHDVRVKADILPEDMCLDTMEMLVLPGGLPGADYLEVSPDVAAAIEHGMKQGAYLAAICAAPAALAKYGALDGKNATCYPGRDPLLTKGGAKVDLTQGVIVDGNIITGKGPGLSLDFALTLCGILKGEETAKSVASDMLYDR